MSISAVCTACGRNFFAPSQFAGKRVKCKGCGEIFLVPDPSGSAEDGVSEHDSLSELASLVQVDSAIDSRRGSYTDADHNPDDDQPANLLGQFGLAPNVLRFDYPGADDVDRWLPIALIVISFLLIASGTSTSETSGYAWISFTRFLVPSALYAAFTFPITLTMLRRAARELRYAMPPNFRLRCFAAYMPAFMLMTWAQFAGDGFTVVQVIAGVVGLGISSLLLWLFFRLREEHIGTSVAYGAGGFAIGAVICGALLLGVNKIAALVVTQEHALASVPMSPFGTGFSWPTPPPPPPSVKPAVQPSSPSQAVVDATVAPTTPVPQTSQTLSPGSFDPQSIPGVIGDVIDPLSDSPCVGILRNKQGGVIIESWNTQTWEKLPGSLQLPARPTGNIVISNDGQYLAWVAEFPRLSIQVWSFASATVAYSVDLDRDQGPANLVAFVGDNLLMVDRMAPRPAPVVAPPVPVTPASPTTTSTVDPAKPHTIFDGMGNPPPKVIWADPDHAPANPPATPDQGGAQAATPGQTQTPTPVTPSVTPDEDYGHLLSIVDVTSGSTVRSFVVPPLATDPNAGPANAADVIRYGNNFSISVKSQRLVAACKIGGTPSLVQFDLSNGKMTHDPIKITEIDPGLGGSITGLGYSNDGQNLAALFENGGSALLLSYDANSCRKLHDFVYPSGPLEGAAHWLFHGSSICWLDPSPCWLVYGQGIVSTQSGSHLKSNDLSLSDVGQQRCMEGDRVELLTNTTAGKKLYVLLVDRSKLGDAAPN